MARIRNKESWLTARVPFTAPLVDGEDSHLFCCVGGRTFLIERGVQVRLPRYVVLALQDAAAQKRKAAVLQRSLQRS